jgi:N4-gp56 family major capsid protein
MAQSTISSGNVVTNFQKKVNRQYVREGRFGPYIGKDTESIIQVKQDLKRVSIPLVAKLSGAGVTGSGQLTGNEEALANYAYTLTPTYYRNGVLIDNEENEKSEFELFEEAKPALMGWGMELKRDQIIQSLGAVEAGGVYYNYGAASAANLDTWVTNNADRILYGVARSNLVVGNHTSSLANIDTTNDKLTPDVISLAKRMAMQSNPLIRPVNVKGDESWFVMFVGSFGFRDLAKHPTMSQANRDALARGKDNPLFTGGDLIWDGVIIHEVPDMDRFIDQAGNWGSGSADNLAIAGNTASRVGVGFLCGAQAIGFGLGRMPEFTRRKEDDYGHQNGVGLSLKQDIKKTFYNNKQHGMVTVFHSATVDA